MYTNRKRLGAALLVVSLVAVFGWTAWAKDPAGMKTRGTMDQGKMQTLDGRLVDLQCFMTNSYASADHARCSADCIRAGVPCAVETDKGLIVIGEGMKSPSTKLSPFALENVKITGKYYERDGVKYIDLEKIEKSSMKKLSSSAKTHSGRHYYGSGKSGGKKP